MSLTAAQVATGPAAWADALLLSFAQAGYVRAEPAILQPAEPFLDLSGADTRKRLNGVRRREPSRARQFDRSTSASSCCADRSRISWGIRHGRFDIPRLPAPT